MPEDMGTHRLERAYLVRCWCEYTAEDHECAWRYSLEEVYPARHRAGFHDLQSLVGFLQADLAGNAPSSVAARALRSTPKESM